MSKYKRNDPEIYEIVPLSDLLKKHKISATELTKRCKLKSGQISNIINHPTKNVNLSTLEQLMVAFEFTSWDQLIRKKKN